MCRGVIKKHERKLLLERVFPTPVAGLEDTLALFPICSELGDPYCLSFNENGYTDDYKPLDSQEVIDRATDLLTEKCLPHYAEKCKDKLYASDSKGRYYTYDYKIKNLRIESEWEKIDGKGGKAVLRAIWEASANLGMRRNNHNPVLS